MVTPINHSPKNGLAMDTRPTGGERFRSRRFYKPSARAQSFGPERPEWLPGGYFDGTPTGKLPVLGALLSCWQQGKHIKSSSALEIV